MPRHRQVIWAGLSTVAMVLGLISMATAQEPVSSGRDPFDAAEKSAPGSSGKQAGANIKPAEESAEKKPAKKAEPEFVRKTLREWQRTLPRGVFEVTRLKATEPPFTGRYATGHFEGTFVCACCDAPLFSSKTKFDSGTGWPSFWQPVKPSAVGRAIDNSDAEPRIEVMCRRCGAHLGHVFDDAIATPTGLRYCINSLSLKLEAPEGETARPGSAKAGAKSKVKTARGRSRTLRSSRSRATAKTTDPGAAKPAGSQPPATGKTDGDGR